MMKSIRRLPSRLKLLIPVLRRLPELGVTRIGELESLVMMELKSLQVLETWIPYGNHLTKAVAPRSVYLVCSHNLAISAWQAIVRSLILGSRVHVKMASTQRGPILRFIKALPEELRSLVTYSAQSSLRLYQRAEVVVGFGRNESLVEIQRGLNSGQKFIGYGHQVSVIWLGKLNRFSGSLLDALVQDITMYDQLGCQSPQAIYLERGSNVDAFCQALGKALDAHPTPAHRPLEQIQITSAIQELRLSLPQATCLMPKGGSTHWTIFQHRKPGFHFSCGYRTIHVYAVAPTDLGSALKQCQGHLSTVGYHRKISKETENIFIELGATRFCPVGRCQYPAPTWHHDGRPQLGDWVRWIDKEMNEVR